MGCIVCNILNMKSPFRCKTEEEKDMFLHELAYDIAANHPEIIDLIKEYVKKLKDTECIVT